MTESRDSVEQRRLRAVGKTPPPARAACCPTARPAARPLGRLPGRPPGRPLGHRATHS